MENSLSNYKKGVPALRLPAKATIYYMLTSALAKLVGILTTPIFTRILSSADYGRYTFYMSWLGLFTVICSSVISPTVIYRGLEKFKDRNKEFIFSAFALGWGSTLIFSLILLLFSDIIGLEKELAFIMVLQLSCDIVINLCQTVRRYNYNYRSLSVTNAVSVALVPILAMILIEGAKIGFRGRIYALLIISLAIAAPHLALLLRSAKHKFDRRLAIYISKHTLPLVPHSVSVALSAEVDKLMITALLGAEQLAKYSVAHTLGLGLGFAVGAVTSALHPWVMRKLSSDERGAVLPVSLSILTALGAVGIIIAVFVPEIFAFLAPGEYSVARLATLPLLLSTLPSFASSFITLGLVHAERGGYTSYSAVASVALGILLNFILISRLEYFGAALSLLVSSLATLAINYRFLKRFSDKEMFSALSFIKIFALTLLGVCVSALSYSVLSLRIFILILPATMLLYAFSGIKDLVVEEN